MSDPNLKTQDNLTYEQRRDLKNKYIQQLERRKKLYQDVATYFRSYLGARVRSSSEQAIILSAEEVSDIFGILDAIN